MDRRFFALDSFVRVLLRPTDHEFLDPCEDFLQDDNTLVRRPHGGRQLSWESRGNVLIRDLDYGAFAMSVRGRRTSQRKRNTILYSFRPRETSSGKNPTCCLWLGLIPLLTGSRRRVADSLTVVSSCSEFRSSGSNL